MRGAEVGWRMRESGWWCFMGPYRFVRFELRTQQAGTLFWRTVMTSQRGDGGKKSFWPAVYTQIALKDSRQVP